MKKYTDEEMQAMIREAEARGISEAAVLAAGHPLLRGAEIAILLVNQATAIRAEAAIRGETK